MPAVDPSHLPRHIGFILDGNRRWAKEHDVPSLRGHQRGLDVFRDIVIAAAKMDIQCISAFMFSTENWSRPKTEIEYLMRLIIKFSGKYVDELIENDIRVVHVGTRDGLPPAVLRAIDSAVAKSAHCRKAVVAMCINYGGQQEIVDAARKLLRERVDPATLTINHIARAIYQPELPDLDLIIRTSGEYRLSGFMLWRSAYSELVFVDKHWPDFTAQDLALIIKQYGSRERRFGK